MKNTSPEYRAILDERYERLLKENYRKNFYDSEELMCGARDLVHELLLILDMPKTAHQLLKDYTRIHDIE